MAGSASPVRPVLAVASTVSAAAAGMLTVLVQHGLTREYGDVTASVPVAVLDGPATTPVAAGLLAVLLLALPTVLSAHPRWVRVAAAAVPLLTVVGVLAATPVALAGKLDAQYGAAPRCVVDADAGTVPSPGSRAARRSQRTLDSVPHRVLFHGGGGSGVGGCDRGFVVPPGLDVVARYRHDLEAAGWRVVPTADDGLRAERGRRGLEVVVCAREGRIWAGRRLLDPDLGCGDDAGRSGSVGSPRSAGDF